MVHSFHLYGGNCEAELHSRDNRAFELQVANHELLGHGMRAIRDVQRLLTLQRIWQALLRRY